MGAFVADAVIKQLVLAGKRVLDAKIVILGITFKENCPDIRNSKVMDIVRRLEEYGLKTTIADPEANPEETLKEYGQTLVPYASVRDADCIILAVAHDVFRRMTMDELDGCFFRGTIPKR